MFIINRQIIKSMVKKKNIPWNRGKRQPYTDDIGIKWCNCTNPKLVSNKRDKGLAYCLLCHTPWFH